MGNFYLRMPAGKIKGTPAHWQLISSNLSGPSAEGILKLGTAGGWARHVDRTDPSAGLVSLRDRKGNDWLPALYMDAAPNFFTLDYAYNYVDAIPFDSSAGDFRGDAGWQVLQQTYYDWRRQDYTTTDPQGTAVPTDGQLYLRGSIEYGFPTPSLFAVLGSGTGDSGGGIWYRYQEERMSWASIPIGAFIDNAETIRLNERILHPDGWAKTAQLYRVDIVHHLRALSIDKSELPGRPHYEELSTTTGLHLGVGAIRFYGPTPTQFMQGYPFSGGFYSVPVPRGYDYGSNTGDDIVWTGLLNDVGVLTNAHGYSGLNPGKEGLEVTQSFTIDNWSSSDAIMFFAEVGGLPLPPDIDYVNSHYSENSLTDAIQVRVIYAFDNG